MECPFCMADCLDTDVSIVTCPHCQRGFENPDTAANIDEMVSTLNSTGHVVLLADDFNHLTLELLRLRRVEREALSVAPARPCTDEIITAEPRPRHNVLSCRVSDDLRACIDHALAGRTVQQFLHAAIEEKLIADRQSRIDAVVRDVA